MLGCIKAVLEDDCSLLPHVVDYIDLRQSARLNIYNTYRGEHGSINLCVRYKETKC